MMGFDCLSFDRILDKFGPMFSGHTTFDESGMIVEFDYTHGQKRVVQPADCLGLVLVWMRTRGSLNVLQLVFGLTLSNLSVYLRFGIRLMVEMFKNNPLARVAIPCNEDIESFRAAFAEQQPLLNDCWVTMDGLKLYLQSAGNSEIQERFYKRWTHNHYVTSVFCFCPNGGRMCIRGPVGCAALTPHSRASAETFYVNCARISWVPTHLRIRR